MEAPLLAAATAEEDYAPARSVREVKSVFWKETVKLWKIAGPIVFTILCNFGVLSVTNIFAGHLGDLELSAVTISLSVIGTFSFGFLVSLSPYIFACFVISQRILIFDYGVIFIF